MRTCVHANIVPLLLPYPANMETDDYSAAFPEPGNSLLPDPVDRPARFAGTFYHAREDVLRLSLQAHFSRANDHQIQDIRALIVPHAGYVYSGDVSAEAYRQLAPRAEYDTVFLIGSSHRTSFHGASIYHLGDYQTPLGRVRVNRHLALQLMQENAIFRYSEEAHKAEHSLEVQLPFLQYRLEKSFQILPIIIGTQDKEECREIAMALRPYFHSRNLFIISTDFSHYPPPEEARINDLRTARAIASNSSEALLAALESNKRRGIPGLATSLCGWTSVLCLLHLSREIPNGNFHLLKYENSGDKELKNKREVVGYYALAFSLASAQNTQFALTLQEKDMLLMIARRTLEMHLDAQPQWSIDAKALPHSLKEDLGVFVSLKLDGKLRGCIGRFNADLPLYLGVQKMAIAAGTNDSRFNPLTPAELPGCRMEISVLGPMRKISSIQEIIPGIHGIYIRKGLSSGTFLPQVASDTGWSVEELLGHCSRDKAGIGWDGWRKAEVYVYEALVFAEER